MTTTEQIEDLVETLECAFLPKLRGYRILLEKALQISVIGERFHKLIKLGGNVVTIGATVGYFSGVMPKRAALSMSLVALVVPPAAGLVARTWTKDALVKVVKQRKMLGDIEELKDSTVNIFQSVTEQESERYAQDLRRIENKLHSEILDTSLVYYMNYMAEGLCQESMFVIYEEDEDQKQGTEFKEGDHIFRRTPPGYGPWELLTTLKCSTNHGICLKNGGGGKLGVQTSSEGWKSMESFASGFPLELVKCQYCTLHENDEDRFSKCLKRRGEWKLTSKELLDIALKLMSVICILHISVIDKTVGIPHKAPGTCKKLSESLFPRILGRLEIWEAAAVWEIATLFPYPSKDSSGGAVHDINWSIADNATNNLRTCLRRLDYRIHIIEESVGKVKTELSSGDRSHE